MPSSHIWALTTQGNVYILSSTSNQWEGLCYCGIEFKRVSAVDWCAWGIGGDHQIYVFVFATGVPIRFDEISFENQRWNPMDGFSTRLLPTDRPGWSSEDGLTARPFERIKLPTLSWQWEGDWRVEHDRDGRPSDLEGWRYAVDFPGTYTREKTWLSCVRRRKWVRTRRYVSTNTWANVPCVHDDPVEEPFIDIAVGGMELPGGSGEEPRVWTVTVLGRVLVRTDVSLACPEGRSWLHVPTVIGGEVNQISVGPTGLVWAVTWNGRALARLGVTRSCPIGSDWRPVEPPSENSKLLQVSVGVNAIWAITRDSKVWFRKGICGAESGVCDESAAGTGWVEMVGEMSLLSVGLNDQVWALSGDERKILLFRTGVTPQELSGKTWRPILLPRQNRDTSCSSSEDSLREDRVRRRTVDAEDGNFSARPGARKSSSAPPASSPMSLAVAEAEAREATGASLAEEFAPSRRKTRSGGTPVGSGGNSPVSSLPSTPRMTGKSTVPSFSSIHGSIGWLSVEDPGYYDDVYSDFSWSWINGSGCLVDGQNPPNWFGPSIYSQSVSNEPWRKDIVKLLSVRHSHEVEKYSEFEQAIDKTAWVTSAKAQILLEGRHNHWVECKLELEKMGAEDGIESATLRCFHNDNQRDSQKVVVDMENITCVVCASDRYKPSLAVYTFQRTIDKWPLRLAFTSDSELEDWITLLSTTCCKLREIEGTPSPRAVWSLTKRGDVFVYDPPASGEALPSVNMFWRQLGGHLRKVDTCPAGVVWGLGYNNMVWVYTGGWGGGCFKGMDSSASGIFPMSDTRCMYIYENQRWNPLTGFSNRGLPTDRYMWSDKTGRHECTKDNTSLPSIHWQWVTEWMIDFNTPGGVDKEGWQFAKDFPMGFHGYKGLADYVRRRRWFRKCKLMTTGPWEELDSVHLLDISLQVDHSGCPNTPISVWGVSVKGEVLSRIGVTRCCPQGVCWEHVPLEQPAQSVSVGGSGEVWVVGKNGGTFLRHGIGRNQPTGTIWFSVAPPDRGSPLRHVSAGPTTVWAVDAGGSLWFRQEVMPVFPEGTSWKHVCGNMHSISVGPRDQLWGIADVLGSSTGVVCKRTGVTSETKTGNGWDYTIGSGWHQISVRGFDTQSD